MTETKQTNEAFDRFRKLTQQVVNTPKAKVDALAQKEKAKKPIHGATPRPA